MMLPFSSPLVYHSTCRHARGQHGMVHTLDPSATPPSSEPRLHIARSCAIVTCCACRSLPASQISARGAREVTNLEPSLSG